MKSVYMSRVGRVVWAILLTVAAGAALLPVPLLAGQMSFEIPVDCKIGQACFIQNYYDDDPGPDRKDYACGRLSYDGHTGTDFRLKSLPAMQSGVAVLAAAPGVVKGVRDGMPDISIKEISPGQIKGREAGNGVVIDHGNGWVSQYSHLMRHSVIVKTGQTVKTGEKLGLIGLSGNTEFPHVEFALRYKGTPVDPFVGINGWSGCKDTAGTVWSATALENMPYMATGALIAGFSQVVPDAEKARKGVYAALSFPADANLIIFWVDLFGAQKGDREEFRISDPNEKPLLDQTQILNKSNVSWFAYAGCRRPEDGWQKGRYKGGYRLIREDQPIVSINLDFEIN
jgi:murein DD-endopeptidase MepM/ murein hydrolase activator NlpD